MVHFHELHTQNEIKTGLFSVKYHFTNENLFSDLSSGARSRKSVYCEVALNLNLVVKSIFPFPLCPFLVDENLEMSDSGGGGGSCFEIEGYTDIA